MPSYFQNYPSIEYTTKYSSNILKDLTLNVRPLQDFIDSIPERSEYHLSDYERLDTVAYNVYEDPSLHWVIMLANGIYDIWNDMPLAEAELDLYIKSKYGVRYNDAHHFEDMSGNIVQGKFELVLNDAEDEIVVGKTTYSQIKPGDILKRKTKFAEYSGLVLDVSGQNIIVLTNSGSFEETDEVSLYRCTLEKSLAKNVLLSETSVLSSKLLPGYSMVSFYDFEKSLNEKKKIIKIIPPEYIPQLIKEFNSLI